MFGWRDIVEAMTTVESGHRAEHRVHPGGDARGRDPRGRPRRRRPRLPGQGRALDAAVDPQARRLARPLPGHGEGRAVLALPQPRDGQPDHDARRDGRRAGVLRRELAGRQRRRPERDRDRRGDGRRCGRWGPSRSTSTAALDVEERRRARSSSGSSGSASTIMNRAGGGVPMLATTRSARCSATATSARAAAQILGQAYVTAYALMATNRDADRADRRHPDRAQGDARRRGRRPAQQRRACSGPSST